MQDLMDTLGQLASWDVSLIAQTRLTFDLSTLQGKLIANLMASLAEFEHDLQREAPIGLCVLGLSLPLSGASGRRSRRAGSASSS